MPPPSPTISVSVDLLERAINALDVGMHSANLNSDTEDVVQIRSAYDELVAVVAEHSEMEDDEDA